MASLFWQGGGMTRRGLAALLSALAVVSAACGATSGPAPTSTPSPGPARSDWREVPPPAPGARLVAFARVGDALLATGSVPAADGRAPGAWTTRDGRGWQAVPLHPESAYARLAELVQVAVAGDRITALGQAFGGAHGNPRVTAWTGSVTGLAEHEQAFELFGGPHAIAVSGAAAVPGRQLLTGQWDGPDGRAVAAVWTSADGVTWDRRTDDPALSQAPGEQTTSALGGTATPTGFLLVGVALRGTALAPLAWTSPDGARWQRQDLPGTGGAGGTADRVACAGQRCAVIGTSPGERWSVLCWPVAGGIPGSAVALPGDAAVKVTQALVRAAGPDPVLATLVVSGAAQLVGFRADCGGGHAVPLPVSAPEARVAELPTAGLLLATSDPDHSRLWLHP